MSEEEQYETESWEDEDDVIERSHDETLYATPSTHDQKDTGSAKQAPRTNIQKKEMYSKKEISLHTRRHPRGVMNDTRTGQMAAYDAAQRVHAYRAAHALRVETMKQNELRTVAQKRTDLMKWYNASGFVPQNSHDRYRISQKEMKKQKWKQESEDRKASTWRWYKTKIRTLPANASVHAACVLQKTLQSQKQYKKECLVEKERKVKVQEKLAKKAHQKINSQHGETYHPGSYILRQP